MSTEFKSIAHMFITNTATHSDNIAFSQKIKGEWVDFSYGKVRETVKHLSFGLRSLGADKGSRIAIMSANRVEWAWCDYAVNTFGGIVVTIYPTLLSSQVLYLLLDSESSILFTEDKEQTDKALQILDRTKDLRYIVVMDNTPYEQDNIFTLDELAQMGIDYLSKNEDDFEARADAINLDDILTIIYTSGTTGEPKGVMLTHGNLISNIDGGLKALQVYSEDVFLSFLPLSHSFERMAGHFLPFTAGARVAYAESIDTVAENMGEIRPTLMTAVPRLYEKMYGKILDKISSDPPLRQKIFHWAIKVGKQVAALRLEKKKPGGWLKLRHNLAAKLVYSKLRARVGGRLRFFVSGGAPLTKEIAEFFEAAGILVLEGYGLTETSPVICVNLLDNYKMGTVGLPLYNVEVKIGEDGEVLTRGPHVMKGYYKLEEATREAIDEDNWFHTGDIGMLDDDGFLKITDRKKDILVTSGGKNVAPAPMENQLKTIPIIEQVLVIGDQRNFISALIVPNEETLVKWAKEKGLSTDINELVDDNQVIEKFQREIDKVMVNFAQYETIKKFKLIPEPFSIEDKTLTPKLSIKRGVVIEKYKDLIDEMYQTS